MAESGVGSSGARNKQGYCLATVQVALRYVYHQARAQTAELRLESGGSEIWTLDPAG